VLPFLERLLYRPRDVASIRVLVITPTRELAQQIHVVLEKLAQVKVLAICCHFHCVACVAYWKNVYEFRQNGAFDIYLSIVWQSYFPLLFLTRSTRT